ncbi:hypothetical protein Bca52824_060439 [Brassica carinata]|uniref:Uncharacterized protein n=1 Tax=Brassica carinata TaxID=52824 RepID=A0A8X7R3J1_BRACI|nr:hypothetical protein Bca52824_060439 [Brassica carinata]
MWSICDFGVVIIDLFSPDSSLAKSLAEETLNSTRDGWLRMVSATLYYMAGTIQVFSIKKIYMKGSPIVASLLLDGNVTITQMQKKKIEDIKDLLKQAQTEDDFSHEVILRLKWSLYEAFRDEELYWKQKSRATWLREGDQNTKFFHATTKQRRARNE